jgi:hypothetical protein
MSVPTPADELAADRARRIVDADPYLTLVARVDFSQ